LRKVVTGNEAAAYGAMLSRPVIVAAYPITPQTRIPEQISEFVAEGRLKAKFVNVESEMSALGYVIGAAQAGVRVFTATSGQGLAWMHEEIPHVSGSRLPIVMVDVHRPLSAPMNLVCGQEDTLFERDTGWVQLYCESNQEVLDTVIQAYRLAESVFLPVMVCMDGVYLSYLMESIDVPDQDEVDKYLPPYDPTRREELAGVTVPAYVRLWEDREHPLPERPRLRSRTANKYEQHKLSLKCLEEGARVNEEFAAMFGRSWPLVEEYKCDDADVIVVPLGSAAGTGRHVINELRARGHKVGLLKLKMFRPFPVELVRKALSGRKVAVIERDVSPGQCGILHQEIKWALYDGTPTYGFVGGLGGEDISAQLIEKAIMYAIENGPQDVIWLGVEEREEVDDYDRKSIKVR